MIKQKQKPINTEQHK